MQVLSFITYTLKQCKIVKSGISKPKVNTKRISLASAAHLAECVVLPSPNPLIS